MFATFNFANIVYVWFFIKETNGKSLEEMEVVFGTVRQMPPKPSVTNEQDEYGQDTCAIRSAR